MSICRCPHIYVCTTSVHCLQGPGEGMDLQNCCDSPDVNAVNQIQILWGESQGLLTSMPNSPALNFLFNWSAHAGTLLLKMPSVQWITKPDLKLYDASSY